MQTCPYPIKLATSIALPLAVRRAGPRARISHRAGVGGLRGAEASHGASLGRGEAVSPEAFRRL
jgi:hypothetical protein